MAQVHAVQVAGRDDAFRPRAGDTTRITGDLRDLRRAGDPARPLVEGNPGGPTEVRVRVLPIDDDDFTCDACGPEFDDRLVQRALRARLRAIQACYEHRIRLNPTLAGKVEIEFQIEEVGSVSHVRVLENTTGDSGMSECVAAPIRSLRFTPGPVGGNVTVSYPFIFARQQ
jgi:TonB family protein